MPTLNSILESDIVRLRETISKFDFEHKKCWSHINVDNYVKVSQITCKKESLFEYLIKNNYAHEAYSIISTASLLDDRYLELIIKKHNQLSLELIKLLATNDMILIFENYIKMRGMNFSNPYRESIAKMYNENVVIDQLNS